MPKEQANIYRQRAAECEALARHYENTPLAKYFLELAEQWRQLADQTERSESRVKRMLRLFGYKGWKGAVESDSIIGRAPPLSRCSASGEKAASI
jgi:hypothetical protein